MTRPVLFVMDPIAGIDPMADTTFDFMLEAKERGQDIRLCTIGDLVVEGSRGSAVCQKLTVQRPTEEDPTFFSLGASEHLSLDEFRVVWMRKDPPVDETFILSTLLLDRHDPKKTLVLNTPASLRIANEKLWGLFAADLFPKTVVSARPEILTGFIERVGKGVVKPVSLMGGAGVMVFEKGDRNLKSAVELLTQEGKRPALAQEYLPAVRHGDKRVILLGGECIGAVNRVPLGDDHRANMHVGGSVERADITDSDRAIAARLKDPLLELGLHFVGIDVIGDKVTEINVTSPTGVQEIDRLDGRTGSDRMRAQVMDYVDGLLEARGIA
jgi:glutathione synthase